MQAHLLCPELWTNCREINGLVDLWPGLCAALEVLTFGRILQRKLNLLCHLYSVFSFQFFYWQQAKRSSPSQAAPLRQVLHVFSSYFFLFLCFFIYFLFLLSCLKCLNFVYFHLSSLFVSFISIKQIFSALVCAAKPSRHRILNSFFFFFCFQRGHLNLNLDLSLSFSCVGETLNTHTFDSPEISQFRFESMSVSHESFWH